MFESENLSIFCFSSCAELTNLNRMRTIMICNMILLDFLTEFPKCIITNKVFHSVCSKTSEKFKSLTPRQTNNFKFCIASVKFASTEIKNQPFPGFLLKTTGSDGQFYTFVQLLYSITSSNQRLGKCVQDISILLKID